MWLIVFFTWTRSKEGVTSAMEAVPQASLEQCEANGAALKGVYSEVKWKCIKGVTGTPTR